MSDLRICNVFDIYSRFHQVERIHFELNLVNCSRDVNVTYTISTYRSEYNTYTNVQNWLIQTHDAHIFRFSFVLPSCVCSIHFINTTTVAYSVKKNTHNERLDNILNIYSFESMIGSAAQSTTSISSDTSDDL